MLRVSLLKIKSIFLASGLILPSLLLINMQSTFAVTVLSNRTLSIASSTAGANTNHTFTFEFPITETVGSINFQYCTDPIDVVTCVNPTASDVSGATLVGQGGETGFAIVSQGVNSITIGRTPSVVGNGLNMYSFDNAINPGDKGPFFVRISAYASSDGSGPVISFSSVAGSINQGINISGEVPEILNFCTGIVVPDCSSTIGDFIDFGILRSSNTSFGTSQFMVGTNAPNGYNVTINGPTMTSGSNTINNLASPTLSFTGQPQFGLNLRANLIPTVGADEVGGIGFVMPSYNNPNQYTYIDGDIVASATGRSENSLFTVSYIINVKPTQAAGVYNTTVTYVCTAGF
jgi:hypothetical protein